MGSEQIYKIICLLVIPEKKTGYGGFLFNEHGFNFHFTEGTGKESPYK